MRAYFLSLLLASVLASATSETKHLNLLMLGNGFSEANHLEETIQSMLQSNQMELGAEAINAARFENSSANLTDHVNTQQLTELMDERPWTWVTLQEQSEIPGFYPPDDVDIREDYFERSMDSMLALNEQIQDNGGTTILFQTWGYKEGDPLNSDIYPDYQEMQDKISRGYELYYRQIVKTNYRSRVKIAPCGGAFERIFKDLKDQGKDPLKAGSMFDKLFLEGEAPRKHPSLHGSYMCACVLFQTLTGLDPRQLTGIPVGMDGMEHKILKEAAYHTVKEFGDGPAKGAKRYRPASEASKTSGWRVFNFLFAFLLGGGVIAGWVGWKWRNAVGMVKHEYNHGGYTLAPEAGDMLMELINTTNQEEETNWINPV